jgi:hypothetical protein
MPDPQARTKQVEIYLHFLILILQESEITVKKVGKEEQKCYLF